METLKEMSRAMTWGEFQQAVNDAGVHAQCEIIAITVTKAGALVTVTDAPKAQPPLDVGVYWQP